MKDIEKIFTGLNQGKKAFIPYIMAGYPEPDICAEIVGLMANDGDIIEIGVPFSDPIADGPAIQEAGQIALSHGMNLGKILKFVEKARQRTPTPIVLMSYYNSIYRYGIKRFASDLKTAGVSGVIVPDLPPEEAEPWIDEAGEKGIATIFLIAPTSTDERISKIGEVSKGFAYYVSTTGITGTSIGELEEIKEKVDKIKEKTDLPVVVGFGISSPKEATQIAELSDGVVVGSAFIRTIKNAFAGGGGLEEVSDFLNSIKTAITFPPKQAGHM
jgi:tryptophan synthase alpha chain